MKYFIRTFGCQMNVADSDYISGLLEGYGYNTTEDPSSADIIVINTCTVRQHAEDRAISYLGSLRKIKEKNPHIKIYFTGCAASLLARDENELKIFFRKFSYLDGIIPSENLERISAIFNSLPKHPMEIDNTSPSPRSSNPCEFVTISRGCSNYCSYCIVPYARGHLISRPTEEILNEINYLIKRGIKEITLLGQNVNSYNYSGLNFAGLLKKVSNIDGLKSIGFLTSHPRDMSDEIIETIAASSKIRKDFHLPLQSGSDRILSLMNRGYTSQHYLNLIDRIRKLMPDSAITTDIIVGFPSETEEDFEKTLAIVREVNFKSFFAFKYSSRKGTASASMPDDVPAEVKEERLSRLLFLLKQKSKGL